MISQYRCFQLTFWIRTPILLFASLGFAKAGPEPVLGATAIGPLRSREVVKVAVSWNGSPNEVLRGWIDFDRDGHLADEELVLPATRLTEPLQVVDVTIPDSRENLDGIEIVVVAERSQQVARVEGLDVNTGVCGWTEGFGTNGSNSPINAIKTHQGKLFVVGSFTNIAGLACNNIAKWDGSGWTCLPTSNFYNPSFYALAEFDGGLFVAGWFYQTSVPYARHIARWDEDTSTWSAVGWGTDNTIRALAEHDGSLYAGGDFTRAGDSEEVANYVAKWDGMSWSALVEDSANGVNGAVHALTSHDGALYVAGRFTTAGPDAAKRVAMWDGFGWSALGTGLDWFGYALASYNDGGGAHLYVGGDFTTAGGNPAVGVARWDGGSWSALGSGLNDAVHTLLVNDGALIAGGDFTASGETPANRIATWNGSTWSSHGGGLGDRVNAIDVFDGLVYAGGAFTYATNSGSGDVVANKIAAWDGSTWSALQASGNGMTGHVHALTVFDDGGGAKLFAGGQFTTAGATVAHRVASWDGTEWTPLGAGVDSWVTSLTTYDDDPNPLVDATALYAGGRFETAGGVTVNSIAKWNGSAWSALGAGLTNGASWTSADALAVYEGELYVGGDFGRAGSVYVNDLAKWDGTAWSGVGGGVGGGVSALAVYDGDLYVGGGFYWAGGSSEYEYLARWDGSGWSTVSSGSPASGLDGPVSALKVYDGVLYVAGSFNTAGGVTVNNVARWDGTEWSALGNGLDNSAYSLTVFDDGTGPQLYVGGTFSASGAWPDWVYLGMLGRWDGAVWSSLPGGSLGEASYALHGFDDGSGSALFAGGRFYFAGGFWSSSIARWSCTCDCPHSIPQGTWTLLSLGCEPSSATVEDVFGDDLAPEDYDTTWVVVERDENSDADTTLSLTDTLSQGEGYWLRSLDPSPTVGSNGTQAPTNCPASSEYDECFDAALVGGESGRLNIKGFPYFTSIPWKDVRFVDENGIEYNPSEAEDAGIAGKAMHRWTGNSHEAFDDVTPGMQGSLDPHSGFLVRAYEDVNLRIPAPAALASRPLKIDESHGTSLTPGEWFFRLTVEGEEMVDRGNLMGRLSDSVDGVDLHDLEEIAPFGDRYMTAVFPHPDWGTDVWAYASDYRQVRTGAGGTWEFEIRSDSQRNVTLSWEGAGDELADVLSRSRLIDVESLTEYDPSAQNSLSLTTVGPTHRFAWVINVLPVLSVEATFSTEVGADLSINASFSDEDPGDAHSASMDWGDGVNEAAVVDEGAGTISASHVYQVPGEYEAELCVADQHGGRDCAVLSVNVSDPDPSIFADDFESGNTENWTDAVGITVDEVLGP